MPHPPVFRAALAGLLTAALVVLGTLAGAAAPSAAEVRIEAWTGSRTGAGAAETTDPLVVHIDTMSAVLPREGNVEISGTVTNVSQDTFTRVNLHAFASQTPLIDPITLAASAAIDTTEFVGQRVTEPGTFATVDVLAPGESADFADSVPVELFEIPDSPGVYWIGIHALGDGAVPRDAVADGRARTFIPLLPTSASTGTTTGSGSGSGSGSDGDSQDAAVVLPLRGRVWFDEDGRVGGTERWARWLEEGGRLDAALDVADAAGETPYSWLVDPAILLAVTRLEAGNPARSLAPDPTVAGQEPTPTETPDETDVSSSPETLTPSAPVPPDEQSDEERALADAAAAWKARFLTDVAGTTVLTLPFGDLDVSAAARQSPGRYPEALDRAAQVMADVGVASQPALAPENDVLSPEALAAAAPQTAIMLGDNAFAAPPQTPNSVVRMLGHTIVVTSTGAESGGPTPTAADDPLAVRQRLLSEAAIRLTSGDTAPVVMTLPSSWQGEDAASFFSGFGEPWLDVVAVTDVAASRARGIPARSLAYTETDMAAELGASNFAAAATATDASALLEGVLARQTTLERQVLDEVLTTLSEQHRDRPAVAAQAATRASDALGDELGLIVIEAPTAVTLSSDSGPLGATLVNGLDEPVEVAIRATTDGQLTLDLVGSATRELEPNARSLVRFEASTTQPGVHNVRLAVTTVDGTPIGSFDELPIRAAGVSALIWVIMAVSGLVLFGAIGYRLPRQIRARREESAADAAAAGGGTDPDAQPDAQPEPQPKHDAVRHSAPEAT